MIPREKNPEYLNSFLDYSITILNKSPNSVKEYNYDLANFLKFMMIRFKLTNETDLDKIDIIGRIPNRPDLMKPNTYMLEESIKRLNCNKEEVIFIGDNSRDGECAYKFGCEFIALTPTKSKKERMLKKFPNINLVNDFYELKEFLDNKYI